MIKYSRVESETLGKIGYFRSNQIYDKKTLLG